MPPLCGKFIAGPGDRLLAPIPEPVHDLELALRQLSRLGPGHGSFTPREDQKLGFGSLDLVL